MSHDIRTPLNGIKYNHPGGEIKVYCTEKSADEMNCIYEFICSDNGLGTSKEFQQHAFDPFAREGKETRSMFPAARHFL